MSRARDLADAGSKANFLDNVSADINTTYAPLASPDFTGTVDLQGNELILDADGDTSIISDNDDQVDVKIAGTDKFSVDANGIRLGPKAGSSGSDNIPYKITVGPYNWSQSNDDICEITMGASTTGSDDGQIKFFTATNVDTGGTLTERVKIDSDGECRFYETVFFNKRVNSAYFSSIRSVSINDDAVYQVDLSNVGNIAGVFINSRNSAYNTVNCLAQFRKSANAFCDILAQSSNIVEVGSTSTTPTGTSGTNGKVTLFATQDDTLYIENRKGTTISISLTFFGG